MIFSYGSRRLRTSAFSFCRAAVLANSEISSIDCRLSFGSLVHWRMIFRRASRCFFITSGIGTLLEVDYSGSAYQEALCHFSVSSFIVLTVMAKLMRSCSERTSSARSFTSQRPSPRTSSHSRSCAISATRWVDVRCKDTPKPLDLSAPRAIVAEQAVDQGHRSASARFEISQLGAVDLNRLREHRHCPPPPHPPPLRREGRSAALHRQM
jgi:hypothetical protein